MQTQNDLTTISISKDGPNNFCLNNPLSQTNHDNNKQITDLAVSEGGSTKANQNKKSIEKKQLRRVAKGKLEKLLDTNKVFQHDFLTSLEERLLPKLKKKAKSKQKGQLFLKIVANYIEQPSSRDISAIEVEGLTRSQMKQLKTEDTVAKLDLLLEHA